MLSQLGFDLPRSGYYRLKCEGALTPVPTRFLQKGEKPRKHGQNVYLFLLALAGEAIAEAAAHEDSQQRHPSDDSNTLRYAHTHIYETVRQRFPQGRGWGTRGPLYRSCWCQEENAAGAT